MKIAWYGKHFGEEPPINGLPNQGAGGIFFSGCNLRCVFCQNWQISQAGLGKVYSVEELAGMMLDLEKQEAVNVDLVSPTIWRREIAEAVNLARARGLTLPIIWNSNAYESVETVKSLSGLVDIYLPDFKYGDPAVGEKYSGVKNYPAVAQAAIKEMAKQAGAKNVIVRHMILPNNLDNSFKALEIIKNMDKNLPVSLMRQYFPCHQAEKFPEINRQVSQQEYEKVFERMCELGLEDGWTQAENCEKVFLPDFSQKEPFKSID